MARGPTTTGVAVKRRPPTLLEWYGEEETSPWLFALGVIAAIALIGTVGLVVGGLAAGIGVDP